MMSVLFQLVIISYFEMGRVYWTFLRDNPDINISLLSLDHDLGDDKIDGYELVKRLVELNPKYCDC